MTPDLATIDIDGFAGLLADATARATVLLLLSWSLAVWLRRGSAAVRHRLWALALCGSIAMPIASWLVPGWRLPVLPGGSRPAGSGPPAMVAAPTLPAAFAAAGPVAPAPRVPAPSPIPAGEPRAASAPPAPLAEAIEAPPLPARRTPAPWSIPGGWLAAWGVGALVAVSPTLLGLLGNRRLHRRSRPMVDEGWLALTDSLRRALSIRRPIVLLRGEGSPIPMTWGVARPVILLPEDATSWPDRRRRPVLLHELAHVRRVDAGVQLIGRLAAAMYWFHPLAWYALHRMRVECEYACDDCVVHAGERPTDYAGQLVELARSARSPRLSMSIAMARANALEDRLRAMFDEARSHRPLDRRSGWRLAAGAAALVLGLAAVQPGASTARPGESAPSAVLEFEAGPDALESPARGTGRIAGRVVRDGEAIAAAEVILLPPPPKGQDAYYGKLPLRRTTADAAGAFAFDGLPPGRYRVWANHGKMTSRSRRMRGEAVILPESGAAPGPVELRLVPAVRVTVRVTEKATGKPIAGATIQPGWSDFVDDFTADRDGRGQVQPLTRERWKLEVWADGFARQSRWFNLENGSDGEAEFRLEPGGDLEGIVRDPSGKPVQGVGLSVFAQAGHEQLAYVETDAGGRYRLANLPVKLALRILKIEKGDYLHEEIPTGLTGPRLTLDIALKRRPHGGSIVGAVRDSLGRPIAGAVVRNPSNRSMIFREASTGPDGRFRLDDLYESVVGKEVIVRAEGFAPQRLKVEPGSADRPAEVAIAMEPGHRIRGRVTDDKGRPIEGVRVSFGGANHGYEGGGQVTTDAQGRFAFDSLPATCSFAFSKGGFSEVDNRALPLDTGKVVTVLMASAGAILGRALDGRTGRPIRTFTVQVTHSPRREPGDPSFGLRSYLIDPGQVFRSDDGRFQIGDLIVGAPVQVIVSAEGYERRAVERIEVTALDGAPVAEFRLDPLDPASLRTYRGRLRDAAGKPVVGVQVRLIAARDRNPDRRTDFPFNWAMIRSGQVAHRPNVARYLASTTDAKGIFQFDGIPKGIEVELAWWGQGVAPGRADHLEQVAEDKDGWFDITLPAPARIVAHVDRKAYPKAGQIQLSRLDGDMDHATLTLHADQSDYTFDDLAPGEYAVSLTTRLEPIPDRPGAYTTRTQTTTNVTIGEGQTGSVDFKP